MAHTRVIFIDMHKAAIVGHFIFLDFRKGFINTNLMLLWREED